MQIVQCVERCTTTHNAPLCVLCVRLTHNDNRKTHVAINVQGGNDPKATANTVHDAFKTASRSQLSNGLFS